MADINWTENALLDLNDIAEYIALENRVAAQDLVGQVVAAIRRLQTFPESGRRPPEISDSIYREVIVGPCRIFYRYDQTRNIVFVVRVMRSERLLRRFVLSEN